MANFVFLNDLAQAFVCVWEHRVGRKDIECAPHQHLAQSACGHPWLLWLGFVPAPAQVPIVARSEALFLQALGTLLVCHWHEAVLVLDAHLGVTALYALGAGLFLVILASRVA